MTNAHFTSPRQIFPIILTLFVLWTWSAAPSAGAQDYENAVASKLTEITWKEADLKAAQRELAILNQFLGDYDAKAAKLDTARQQLAGADAQLAGIQQDNLVKLTIRMGIETYNTVSETVNLGKSAATALVTSGVTSAVGSVALDQLSSGLTNEGRAALGMDAATLSTARTVKIQAVSDAARAAYPDLARVQQMLAMSLEGVKAAAYHEDGTELGDTGAILRKNIMVREEIAAALAKLDAVGAGAATAKTDADTGVTAAQADVDRITAELTALQNELGALKTEWATHEAAARFAANQDAIVPPADLPVPSPTVEPIEGETEGEYLQRVHAAVQAAAWEQWNSEAAPLIAEIAGLKTGIATAQAVIAAAVETAVTTPDVDYFISVYGGNDTVGAETTASYEGAAGAAAGLESWIAAVTPSREALPGLIEKVEALTDDYTSLANLQNRLQSLVDLLHEVDLYPDYYTAMQVPGMGQNAAEDLAVSLDQKRSQLPKALENSQAQLDRLIAATAAWGSGIGAVKADIGDHLAAAESALAELIARGAAWDAALAAAGPGMTVDFAHGLQESRLGYFSGVNFVPVVQRAFNLSIYKSSMLAAVTTPGAAGLADARDLKARYDALVAATPALKDAFDAARQQFRAAFARLESYTDGGIGFAVLGDWSAAAAYNSTAHPVDASGVTDQVERYRSLFYTSKQTHTTSLTGGDPVAGQGVLFWEGLPQLSQLPDPGMDDPAAYLPHRLATAKAAIVEEGPGWIPLAPDLFNARYNEVLDELFDIADLAYLAGDGSVDAVIISLFGELGHVQEEYTAAHPAPTITVQPAGSRNEIAAGTTYTAQLSVTAAGDFLTYKWYMTRWQTDEFGWEEIPDATSATLTTPALSETRWFMVTVANPGGSATSEAAHVEVYQIYPAPVFTSAASASAKVGVPVSWTFATNIPGAWIFVQGMNLPAWLNFNPMTGTLSGTPEAEGIWDIQVTAGNHGSFGYQTFRLTVAPTLKGDVDGNGAVTLADAVCALQVCAGISPASVNLWGDVNGDGAIGLAEAGYVLQKTAELR